MPQPEAVEAIRDELGRLYAQVQAEQISELERIAGDPSQRRYRARLIEQGKAVSQALDEVDIQARVWASRKLPEVYQIGAMEAAEQTGQRFTWTAIHQEAVAEIAADTYGDLLKATRFVRRDAKAFIRLAARQRTASAVIGGQTATQAGRQLARDLAEQGIKAVRYKNGARHTLADYADTVLRTQTAKAYNVGTLNSLSQGGVGYVEVFDGAACGWTSHNDTDLASGSIRTVAEAASHFIAHPRCARSFGGRPEVKTAQQAKEARRSTLEEQERLATEERERAKVRTVSGKLTSRERQRRQSARLRQREARLAARAKKVRR